MKHISTILCAAVAAAIALVGCEDKSKQKLDPNAKVYISAAKLPQAAPSNAPALVQTLAEGDAQIKLTPLEMLLATNELTSTKATIGIGDENKDTANVRFIVPSIWVIDQHGELDVQFIESRDYLFIDRGKDLEKYDTIGYIRNDLMKNAEREVKAAYAAENYAECYRLLQEAFEFTPTTGAEYKALQASGDN